MALVPNWCSRMILVMLLVLNRLNTWYEYKPFPLSQMILVPNWLSKDDKSTELVVQICHQCKIQWWNLYRTVIWIWYLLLNKALSLSQMTLAPNWSSKMAFVPNWWLERWLRQPIREAERFRAALQVLTHEDRIPNNDVTKSTVVCEWICRALPHSKQRSCSVSHV